jgi:hypothetical protein
MVYKRLNSTGSVDLHGYFDNYLIEISGRVILGAVFHQETVAARKNGGTSAKARASA